MLEAIEGIDKVLPITDFARLAEQIETLREDGEDHGTSWFVSTMKHPHLTRLLEPSRWKQDKQFLSHVSILGRPRRSLTSCSCCGVERSPAATVAKAFENLVVQVGAHRWTGKRGES